MKQYILTGCIVLFAFTLSGAPMDTLKNYTKNAITFSPMKLINNEIEIGIERKLSRLISLKLEASLISNSNDYSYRNNNNNVTGTNLMIAFRKYIFYDQIINKKQSQNLWGVYLSPFVQYQYIERKDFYEQYDINGNLLRTELQKSHQNAFMAGLITGMRFDIAKGLISFDFNVGFATKISEVTGPTNNLYYGGPREHYYGKQGIIPTGNATIGFNF
ncbi:MAG: hypothetical protein KA797_04200 [Chitinophagales bacterium]|nr:hypothetical protein [Chitinophagales bacterium]